MAVNADTEMTAHDYLLAAVRDIDAIFGKGYAAKNPALVGAYMQTAAELAAAAKRHELATSHRYPVKGPGR